MCTLITMRFDWSTESHKAYGAGLGGEWGCAWSSFKLGVFLAYLGEPCAASCHRLLIDYCSGTGHCPVWPCQCGSKHLSDACFQAIQADKLFFPLCSVPSEILKAFDNMKKPLRCSWPYLLKPESFKIESIFILWAVNRTVKNLA